MLGLLAILIGYFLVKFFISLNKDNDDLKYQSLSEKFSILVELINAFAFDGRGSTFNLNLREFNLYQEGSNQIVKFGYSTGHLTITWKYKYFQKEVIHAKQYDNVRNLSIFDQERIAKNLIEEMSVIIENHKDQVYMDSF